MVKPRPVPFMSLVFSPLINGFFKVSNNSSEIFLPSSSTIKVIFCDVNSSDKVAVLPYLYDTI